MSKYNEYSKRAAASYLRLLKSLGIEQNKKKPEPVVEPVVEIIAEPEPVVEPAKPTIAYPFPEPLPRISSPYGYRTHPISKVKKKHNGTDFAAKSGTPIHAIANGVVVKSKKSGHPTGGYGQFIEIDHGDGVHSLYAHMLTGSRKVKTGDKVVLGQHIGDVGSTGYSTGPHLHFEIRLNGSFIDPMKYIAKKLGK